MILYVWQSMLLRNILPLIDIEVLLQCLHAESIVLSSIAIIIQMRLYWHIGEIVLITMMVFVIVYIVV